MHNISNIEIENPILTVFNSESVSDVELELVVLHQLIQVSLLVERNLQFLALSFAGVLPILFK